MGEGPLSGRRGVGAHVPGAGDVGLPAVEVTDELLARRAAVAELGAELRALADLVTRTEAGVGVLRDSARRLREAAPALRERLSGVMLMNEVLHLQRRGTAQRQPYACVAAPWFAAAMSTWTFRAMTPVSRVRTYRDCPGRCFDLARPRRLVPARVRDWIRLLPCGRGQSLEPYR